MPKEDKKHFLGWHSWYVAVEADNLKSWLDCVASVKTLRKSENRGGPTSRGGSSQDLPQRPERIRERSLVPKKALAFLYNLIKLPKPFPNLEPSFLDSNAIDIEII